MLRGIGVLALWSNRHDPGFLARPPRFSLRMVDDHSGGVMRQLLVIDDDIVCCRLMTAIFEPAGFAVAVAHDGKAGLDALATELPDVVALDIDLPGASGLEVLAQIRASYPSLPVVMLTAHHEVKLAVRAMQLGAVDYLTKPVDDDEVVLVFRRAIEASDTRRELRDLRDKVQGGVLATQMGSSAAIAEIIEQVNTVAGSEFTVLVLGETGTGKELIAQAVHASSERAAKPFIAIDCGAIPETLLESELFGHEKGAFSGADRKKQGQFQLAEGGTIFLDEIGNMPLPLQMKLLRALESRQVQPVGGVTTTRMDVRFVAATNLDLQQRAATGQFRADLFFRIAQYTITLPALRERTADIPYLARRFVAEASVELRRPVHDLSKEALAILCRHRWLGNVRELRNVVRQAVLHTTDGIVDADVIRRLIGEPLAVGSQVVTGDRSLKEIADEAAHEAERTAIRNALRAAGGNKTQTARALKTDYKTLHVKMKQLGIEARDPD